MSQDGLLNVRTFVIPTAIAIETIEFLRDVGGRGFEGFALWAGQLSGPGTFLFQSCIIPDQKAMQTDDGLLVTVDGSALFKVNRLIHGRGQVLAAQVHSHPSEAYHSATDDSYPLVTLVGALSIVIPDFATNAPADLEKWAWYRLSEDAEWLSAEDTTEVMFE
jgi:hypothetical protein